MNRLPIEKRAQLIALLVEGTSLRATSRISGVAFNTVLKFVGDIGRACIAYQDKAIRNVKAKRIEADEIWGFCKVKDKNIPPAMRGQPGIGSVWTWIGMDADSKLIVSWLVGDRSAQAAHVFMQDIASRLANRVQLTTDGYRAYLTAVESAFGSEIDYAMLEKIYGPSPEGEKRYSPAECIGCKRHVVVGNPNEKLVSTSFAERQNLTVRMSSRRMTRLTNGFSKKIENHTHAMALHFMWYNFARRHMSLRVSPAMEAGLETRLWTAEDIARLLETMEDQEPKKRGPYKVKAQISN
jgi:IS1 family transposase